MMIWHGLCPPSMVRATHRWSWKKCFKSGMVPVLPERSVSATVEVCYFVDFSLISMIFLNLNLTLSYGIWYMILSLLLSIGIDWDWMRTFEQLERTIIWYYYKYRLMDEDVLGLGSHEAKSLTCMYLQLYC